ncbi:MAG TPA: hypothetical protein VHB02_09265 [Acidimicrobiales bacterium]|nr:hypothetical protein [Acidimicrobiales bacterium]
MVDRSLQPLPPDAEEALLARLAAALAPVAVEPPDDGLTALRAAIRAEWEPPAAGPPGARARVGHRPVPVRRRRWSSPGAVVSGLVGALVLGSGAAFAAGAPIPPPVRTVANEMGLPVASPAVATARQATGALQADLARQAPEPAVAQAARSLAGQLRQLDPQQLAQVGGHPVQVLRQACRALAAGRPGTTTRRFCPPAGGVTAGTGTAAGGPAPGPTGQPMAHGRRGGPGSPGQAAGTGTAGPSLASTRHGTGAGGGGEHGGPGHQDGPGHHGPDGQPPWGTPGTSPTTGPVPRHGDGSAPGAPAGPGGPPPGTSWGTGSPGLPESTGTGRPEPTSTTGTGTTGTTGTSTAGTTGPGSPGGGGPGAGGPAPGHPGWGSSSTTGPAGDGATQATPTEPPSSSPSWPSPPSAPSGGAPGATSGGHSAGGETGDGHAGGGRSGGQR